MTRSRCPKPFVCLSTIARATWGYCRERNTDAGGLRNVTPEMQTQWRRDDAHEGEK